MADIEVNCKLHNDFGNLKQHTKQTHALHVIEVPKATDPRNGHIWKNAGKISENMKQIIKINNEAMKAGTTYGRYVAMKGLK